MRAVYKYAGLALALAMVVGSIGCEWEGASDEDSWNSSYDWANFSGVYKATGNGVLVTDFTSGSNNPEVSSTVTNRVTNEKIGEGNGVESSFSGVLSRIPIVPGSVTITAGGFALTDNNADGILSGNGQTSGTIEYSTGGWSIDLQGIPLGNGENILASFSYTFPVGGTGDGDGGGVKPGSSGKTIYSFTVFQAGNKLEITDNNGAKYNGRMGSLSTTTGGTPSDPIIPSIGDSVIAEYTAEGTSAAGKSVMLTGTYQGVVGRGSGTAMMLTNRRMLGTWIESNGVTGDINGQASPIPISVTTTTAE